MQTLFDAPEIEYLDGRPYPKMSPKTAHSMTQTALVLLLRDLAGKRGRAGTEWHFRIGAVDGTDTVFVPDVAYVAIERLRALSGEDREEPPIAPDIVAEVRSKGESARLRREKIARYRATGTLIVLDVDPQTRTIAVHGAGVPQVYESGDNFVSSEIPWLTFDVDRVFADLDFDAYSDPATPR